MTDKFLLPSHMAIATRGSQSQPLPLRSLAQLMARRFILANATDEPITLAQFNLIMAAEAPDPLKQTCLMHQAQTALDSALHGMQANHGSVRINASAMLYPRLDGFLPDNWLSCQDALKHWAQLTINSVLNHLSVHGAPAQPALPLTNRIRPLPPEDAAWQWAEAMEEHLGRGQCLRKRA